MYNPIGLVLLKTKLASWRYQKISRPISVIPNVKTDNITENVTDLKKAISSDNEDQEIPPAIEDIIEQLIQGLRDKAITIRCVYARCFLDCARINIIHRSVSRFNFRWSAAKGIGRITARLPIDLADDVLGFVLNLFSGRESDSAWHGGCLALAELGTFRTYQSHRRTLHVVISISV